MMTADKPLILEGLAPIVGLRIREARTDKGMSQKDLVGERFSKSYISSIERGKITPSLKALEYIARRLGVTVAYLLTGLHPGQPINSNGVNHHAMEELAEPDALARWDLLLTEARVLREQHRFEQARHLLSTKVRVRQLGVEQLKQYHYALAQLGIDLEDPRAALTELEVARDLAEKTGDAETMARVRQLGGMVYMQQGKPVQAIEQLRLALQAIETGIVRDFHFRLAVYSQLGLLHHQLGDDKEAVEMYRQALQLAEDSTNPEKLAAHYWSLALAYRESGNTTQAKTFAARSLALYESLADLRRLADLRSGFGVLMMESHQFGQAEEQFQMARQLATEHNDTVAQTVASMHLTDLYLEQNDLDRAKNHSEEMERGLENLDGNLRGQALSSRASLLAAQGQNQQAIQYFQEALNLIETSPSKELLSKVYFRYARTLNAHGDTARAAEMFERAYHQLGRPALVSTER